MSFSEDSPASRTRPRHLTPPRPRLSLRSQITQRGPLTFVELQSRWDTNRIDRDAFVWCDGIARLPPDPRCPRAPRGAPSAPSRSSTTASRPPSRDPAPVGSPTGGVFAAKIWKCKGANGEILGPVSAETMRRVVQPRPDRRGAPVWTDGMPAYAPLRDVPALFRVISEDAARGDSIARITHPSTTVATGGGGGGVIRAARRRPPLASSPTFVRGLGV